MDSGVPAIAITNPTPPRTAESNASAYRLLYRGALSLPDSHLLLDGLTFAARLDSPSKHNHLLQNPLALALESMRGRPSLRFMGVVKLDDGNMWLDESGGVEMDIHSRSTLTRIYFENIFCLTPFASTSKSISSTSLESSDVGIKVALGDTDGPDTTEIVIFARPVDSMRDDRDSRSLNLIVARLSTHPPPSLRPTLLRLPRPDDPTPRKPPISFGTVAKRELKRVASIGPNLPGRDLKRAASSSNLSVKRKKLANGSAVLSDLGSGVRLGASQSLKGDDTLFKVPDVPLLLGKSSVKGKGRQMDPEEDVFGGMEMPYIEGQTPVLPGSTTKRKRDINGDRMKLDEEVVEMERANKNLIKRCTLDHLYKAKDPTTTKANKTQPEFKDLFGWVYRGVGYALRAQMKIQPISPTHVDQLVQMHVHMYVGGHGGTVFDAPPRTTDDA